MDKKNTMLLTVIAVATLLVAVVGATFAYFAISGTADNANTTITGTTAEFTAGAIALTGTESLQLNLTAEDMSKANIGHYYFAGAGSTVKSTGIDATGKGEAENNKVTIGTVTLGNGGTEGINYKCTANYTVKISDTTLDFETNDDAVLMLYDGTGVTVTKSDGFATATTNGIDLSTLVTASTTGIKGSVVFDLTSGTDQVTKKFEASLRIKNSSDNQANEQRLTNKNFNITFEVDSFNCDIVK